MKAIARLVITLAALLLWPISGLGQLQMSAKQKEVWAGEERYCQLRMSRDVEGFMSLWDDSFIGWPGPLEAPTDKAGIRKTISRSFATPSQCESTPMAVNVLGDFANTYYLFRTTATDAAGKTTTHVSRITHTWRHSNGRWRIVGGMSGQPSTY